MNLFRKRSDDENRPPGLPAPGLQTTGFAAPGLPAARLPAPLRQALLDSLHLVVLTTFAVTQPVYDRLGERPAFITDMSVKLPALLWFMAALSLLVPALVAGFVWAVGRLAPPARSAAQALAVFVLLVIIALPIAKRTDFFVPPGLVIGMALGLAAAGAWAYFAFRLVRSIVTAAAPAVVIFPALFLFHSPVSAMVWGPLEIRTERWNPVPVVMVVFDEFRGTALLDGKNEIDAERFPHFAELARGSTWFPNATTVHHETMYAVPAMLSGKYPSTLWTPRPVDLPQNLFSVVASTNAFELAVFEPVSILATPLSAVDFTLEPSVLSQAASLVPPLARVFLVHLVPNDLQKSVPEIPRLWFGLHDSPVASRQSRRGVFKYRWGGDRRGQFEHFLDCLGDSSKPGDSPPEASSKPGLYFAHVLLPHVPWCYLPSGRRYLAESDNWELLEFDAHGAIADFWGSDELYVLHSQQRQLLQLDFTDRLLGRLLERLRDSGLYEKCLLVVTADHGISFRLSDSRRNPTPDNLADIMSIPLFVKTPGQQTGGVSDRNVQSVDILPSIMGVLGIELRFPIDGQSIFDERLPEPSDKTMYVQHVAESVPATIVSARPPGNEVLSRFGSARDPDAIYRIGPHPELLGRDIEGLPIDAGAPAEIELIRSGTYYDRADPDAIVPCYLEGRVVVPKVVDKPVHIAVAVNGVIHAVTRTYQLDGLRDRWAAMVPEAAFREGENDLRYYVVSGESRELRLTRCTAKAAAEDNRGPR